MRSASLLREDQLIGLRLGDFEGGSLGTAVCLVVWAQQDSPESNQEVRAGLKVLQTGGWPKNVLAALQIS